MRLAVNWAQVRAVVFDVDGTLYDQKALRRKMRMALLRHCLDDPRRWRTLLILKTFRETREELAEEEAENIAVEQYARPARRLGIAAAEVEAVVLTWMQEYPLRYLRACRFDGLDRLFDGLTSGGRPIAVLSDYPATGKLRALGLTADLQVSAIDAEVDRLKPHPKGLELVVEWLGIDASSCLYIGDREDRDGACARRIGMPYLLKARAGSADGRRFAEFDEVARHLCGRRAADAEPSEVPSIFENH